MTLIRKNECSGGYTNITLGTAMYGCYKSCTAIKTQLLSCKSIDVSFKWPEQAEPNDGSNTIMWEEIISPGSTILQTGSYLKMALVFINDISIFLQFQNSLFRSSE